MKNLIGLFLILQYTFSVYAQQQKWALIDFVKVDRANVWDGILPASNFEIIVFS